MRSRIDRPAATRRRLDNAIAFDAKGCAQETANLRLVLDNENRGSWLCHLLIGYGLERSRRRFPFQRKREMKSRSAGGHTFGPGLACMQANDRATNAESEA